MGTYIGKRLLYAFVILVLVTIVVFTVARLIPGDPIRAFLTERVEMSEESIVEKVRSAYGLDRTIPVQFLLWIGSLLQGEWGISFQTGEPVSSMFWRRLPVTIELFFGATFWAWIIGFPLGVISALKRNSILDISFTSTAIFGVSIPSFWEAIVFIYFFAIVLNILPPSGYVPFSEDPWLNIKSILMPTFVMGTHSAGLLVRYVRSSLLEVLPQDYIRTARAKGLSTRAIIFKHAAKPALVPVVTVIGLAWSHLVAGSFMVEYVFAIPGLGRMGVDAVFARDFPVIQAMLIASTINVLLANLTVDLLYGFIDPRVRRRQDVTVF